MAIFWFAYVVTRPLGASFADWFGKGHRLHGLALGDGTVAGVMTLLIAGCVGYLTTGGRGVRRAVPHVAFQPE